MNLKFGVLADYAGIGAANKAILVGIFDTVFNTQNAPNISLPPFYLFAQIEAHVTEGTEHKVTVHITTGDGGELPVPVRVELPFKLVPRGPGRELQGNLIIALQGMPLPGENSSYEFNILMGGNRIGSVPFYVSEGPHASHS
jgi:hypothetical protein